jgi:glutathione S-transferase
MASVVRLVTFVDVDDASDDDRQTLWSTRHEAVLADGRRVVLLDDRGWSERRSVIRVEGLSKSALAASAKPQSRWASQTVEEIKQTARDVVGPDEPDRNHSRADMEASHWQALAEKLHKQDVDIEVAELEALPHDVELSDRVLARSQRRPSDRRAAARDRPREGLTPMGTLKLYDYKASCNCYKVRLLLANLGRDYEHVAVDIFDGDTLTDDFAHMNPLRSTPVLETPDGRYLSESAAILSYLADGTPLLPSDAFARAEVIRWLVYEQTDVIPAIGGLRFRLQTGRLMPEDPDAQNRRAAGIEVLGLLDAHLAGREFLVGDGYTIADVAVYGYVHVADEAEYRLDDYPHLAAWLARVTQQPGYVNDVEPYPPNAAPGAGRSTYDL